MIWHPSPNSGPRRGGVLPDMVVIHYTAMQSAQDALTRLCDPAFEVSAHYLIAADGSVYQLVQENMRAWHAGAGRWGAIDDVNSRSIGIELDNNGARPFGHLQMTALEGLLAEIFQRWAIKPERVIPHSDMAPARKTDPGRRFDWRRLALQGLSVWPEAHCEEGPQGAEEHAFEEASVQFGYTNGTFEQKLSAFRQRFRPHAHGGVDGKDVALIQNLAKRFPVDQMARTA